MEVEDGPVVDPNANYKLLLVGGEVLIFTGALLKYIENFTNMYMDGFTTIYAEHADYRLDYALWKLVLSFLAEHDKTEGGEVNSWTSAFKTVDVQRLFYTCSASWTTTAYRWSFVS